MLAQSAAKRDLRQKPTTHERELTCPRPRSRGRCSLPTAASAPDPPRSAPRHSPRWRPSRPAISGHRTAEPACATSSGVSARDSPRCSRSRRLRDRPRQRGYDGVLRPGDVLPHRVEKPALLVRRLLGPVRHGGGRHSPPCGPRDPPRRGRDASCADRQRRRRHLRPDPQRDLDRRRDARDPPPPR